MDNIQLKIIIAIKQRNSYSLIPDIIIFENQLIRNKNDYKKKLFEKYGTAGQRSFNIS